jgi:hypothetical protein
MEERREKREDRRERTEERGDAYWRMLNTGGERVVTEGGCESEENNEK